MVAAIRDPDPVVFRDYSEVASGGQPEAPDEAYEVPIGKAVVRKVAQIPLDRIRSPATIRVVDYPLFTIKTIKLTLNLLECRMKWDFQKDII